jgi:hypothetical protein
MPVIRLRIFEGLRQTAGMGGNHDRHFGLPAVRPFRSGCLRVKINHEGIEAIQGSGNGEVNRQGGFPSPALLG